MKKTVSSLSQFVIAVISTSILLISCSKKDESSIPVAAFAGQYTVVDDNETYTLKVENTGGNNFQIREFGGFLNVPLKASAEGNILNIPSQTFTNAGSGRSITITGKGVLSTKNKPDDTIVFQYSLTGYGAHDGNFEGIRK